ncbi:hypothetical protein EKD02_07520 [Chlorobium phaeovibrioides]|uniref:Uncharacterized protein n=1 Tax=Chlorobium phaeovibrioides TaxID=1094 RepID=A0A3S0NYV2_CHLPH|nr:hypothetical protein [Chlorobium phaeovibrioides]MWV54627.1 hypothetical protein [Chlorobium phaeovibrioides]QEQ57432.1 hypothetical protein FNV82_07660 [Chlorobium phaeovibrioides]RTY36958.1 hypothetical protein EKD02_07520 [Chlorobium phaeovibrioides]
MRVRVKKRILDRYERSDDGRVCIDVAARRVEDLYEDFDKTAPYHRKDLDADLADYLGDCVREIGGVDFLIRFTLERRLSEDLVRRIRNSVKGFFLYRRELEQASVRKMLRASLGMLVAGILLLALSLWLPGRFEFTGDGNAFPGRILVEGITIAAWVAIWESLVRFLLSWPPQIRRIRMYGRIAAAPVLVRHHEDGG